MNGGFLYEQQDVNENAFAADDAVVRYPMPDPASLPPMVAVCTPGYSFDWTWMSAWTQFLFQFLQSHSMCHVSAASNNIYTVRNRCIAEIRQTLGEPGPDYILWLDSDNPVFFPQFLMLKQALIDHPEASGVGGWYYIQSGIPAGAEVAAGWTIDGVYKNTTLEEVNQSKDLLEVDWIGFGFLLMRGSILKYLDAEPFVPVPNGYSYHPDDTSFMIRAKAKGHRFFLHPKVHVQHLKMLPLVARPDA